MQGPTLWSTFCTIGCESVVLAIVAQERGFTYSGVTFDLRGSLDVRGLEGVEGVRPYFDKVYGTINVETSEKRRGPTGPGQRGRTPVPRLHHARGRGRRL